MKDTDLDNFIQRRIGKPVDVYLLNGIKLSAAQVIAYDREALILRAAGDLAATQMVMWSAISTVASRGLDPE